MYHPTTRVLTVLELLQSRHRITGAELAERLSVDVRTIRRYIAMLEELGIPVMAERGRYGAYRLMPGFKLPPLMFTEDEALALTLGLLAARHMGLAMAAPAVEGALAKVERVLPTALRGRLQAVQSALTLDLAAPEARPANDVVLAFSTAAQQSRRLRLRYRTASGRETNREIDPYGLVYRTGRWYAAGYCHLRHSLRTFRLDRVVFAVPGEETFDRPAGFDTLAFVLNTLATMPWGAWSIHVLLHTSIEHARYKIPPETGALTETPQGVELRCTVDELDWMAHFLVGLGCPFTVFQPPELRGTLRALAADIARMADASEAADAPLCMESASVATP